MNRSIFFPVTWPALVFALAALTPTRAAELESFTEPYKQVAVPAAEIGTLAEILVAEGDVVSEGQLLARLDDTVLVASLEVARAAKDALGARRGAESELTIRRQQYQSFLALVGQGNATERELARAEGELQQAEARLQSVREDLELRRLEYERVRAQLKLRKLESPINGHVVQLEKEVGEFVAPTDPIVMRIVQLNTLKTVFSVPIWAADRLQAGQTVELSIGRRQDVFPGTIEFVSPVAEAQSATVAVKIRIPNSGGKIRSGALCRWDLETTGRAQRVSRASDRSGSSR